MNIRRDTSYEVIFSVKQSFLVYLREYEETVVGIIPLQRKKYLNFWVYSFKSLQYLSYGLHVIFRHFKKY